MGELTKFIPLFSGNQSLSNIDNVRGVTEVMNYFLRDNKDGSYSLVPRTGLSTYTNLSAGNNIIAHASTVRSATKAFFTWPGRYIFENYTARGQVSNVNSVVVPNITKTDMALSKDIGNYQEIALVWGSNEVAWVQNSNFGTTMLDAGRNVDSIEFLHGYFFASQSTSNGEQFYSSALANVQSWPSARFATAEYARDGIIKLYAYNDNLWIFGGSSIEVWYDTGNPDFPLEPMPNMNFDIGLYGANAIAEAEGLMFFLGRDKNNAIGLYATSGGQIQKLDIGSVEEELSYALLETSTSVATNPRDVSLFGFSDKGKSYIGITYDSFSSPTVDASNEVYPEGYARSWAYSIQDKTISRIGTSLTVPGTTGLFFNRTIGTRGLVTSLSPSTTSDIFPGSEFYRVNSNIIYATNVTQSTDNGSNIEKWVVTKFIEANDDTIFHHRLSVETSNVSITSPEPVLVLSTSDDEGRTFSQAATSNIYKKRIVDFYRLGSSKKRVYKLATNSNTSLAKAYIEVTKGNH